MSNEDIVLDYKLAKYKNRRIGILADLNGCRRDDIKIILRYAGVLPEKLKRTKSDWHEKAVEMVKDGKKPSEISKSLGVKLHTVYMYLSRDGYMAASTERTKSC